MNSSPRRLAPGELLQLKRWNTPTLYNGFLALPDEDVPSVLEAARFMDANECNTLIAAARSASGKTTEQFLAEVQQAAADFGRAASEAYQRKAEF
jgi:4-hydroxy-4-methyl-2-oxoglutarate aldolase